MKQVGILLAGTLILSACGSSDPGVPYKVTTTGDRSNKVPVLDPNAAIAGQEQFVVDADGLDANKELVISEGTQGKATLHIRKRNFTITDVGVTPEAGTLPAGASFTQIPNDKFSYVFAWSPPIIPGSPDKQSYTFKINIQPTAGSDSRILGLGQEYSLRIVVSKLGSRPVFKSISYDFPGKGVNEGDVVRFSLDIQDDIARTTKVPPTVYPVGSSLDQNPENPVTNGSVFIHPDLTGGHKQGQEVSPGIYRYFYYMDTSFGVPWPTVKAHPDQYDKTAQGLPVCFDFMARNFNKQEMSAPVDICTTIHYAAQMPSFSFEPNAQFLFKAGETRALKFTIRTEEGRGSIAHSDPAAAVRGWPGNPTLACDDTTNANESACTLTWTPACTTKSYIKTLSMTAKASGGKKTSANATLKQALNVDPNPDCKSDTAADAKPATKKSTTPSSTVKKPVTAASATAKAGTKTADKGANNGGAQPATTGAATISKPASTTVQGAQK